MWHFLAQFATFCYFLAFFALFWSFGTFTQFCRELNFVVIYALFRENNFGTKLVGVKIVSFSMSAGTFMVYSQCFHNNYPVLSSYIPNTFPGTYPGISKYFSETVQVISKLFSILLHTLSFFQIVK